MNKIFMDRVTLPENTVEKQKEIINSLGIEFEMKHTSDPDKRFFTSQITVSDAHKHSGYKITSGKGLSLSECFASNYGELLERYIWHHWKTKIQEEYVPLFNLITQEYNIINVQNLLREEGRNDYIASGNNLMEAIYHVLTEAYEYGLLNSHYPYTPIEVSMLKTEEIYPEWPQYIHDNYAVILREDSRLPLYDVTAFKSPSKLEKFVESRCEVVDDLLTLRKTIKHFSSSYGDNLDEEPWAPLSGSRSGLNIEKTVKMAIAEQVQSHYLLKMNGFISSDIDYSSNKKTHSHYNIKTINDIENREQETIEEDIALIVDAFRKINFGVWILDITPVGSEIKVVKLITDYSSGKDNPHSKRFLSNFFEI